jgi:hypothetical protein
VQVRLVQCNKAAAHAQSDLELKSGAKHEGGGTLARRTGGVRVTVTESELYPTLLLFCLLALCCNWTPKRKLAFASDVAQNAPGVRYTFCGWDSSRRVVSVVGRFLNSIL